MLSPSTILTSLSLRGYQDPSRVAQLGTNLTRLIWKREDFYVRVIFSALPPLFINFYFKDSQDSQNFAQIITACTSLRTLDMSICNFSDAQAATGFDFVFTMLQNLEDFRYSPNSEIETQAIATRVNTANVPQLRKFVVKCPAAVTMTGRFDNLTHLGLAYPFYRLPPFCGFFYVLSRLVYFSFFLFFGK